MKLLKIRQRAWCVMMVYDQHNKCQVLDYLSNIDERQARKMLYLLREYAPTEGPPTHNSQRAEHLEGDVWEFKVGPKRGAKLRVTYFRDQRTVICARAFSKSQQKTPRREITAAQEICNCYRRDKASGQIKIETLGDTDD